MSEITNQESQLEESNVRTGPKEYSFEDVEALYHRFCPDEIDGEGLHIEVAEHSVNIRRQLVESLKRRGFSVHETGDGMEALQHIKEYHPDLVILDGQLGKVNGLKNTEAMRSNSEFKNTPIILVSANKDREDIVKAYKLHVAAYILKPCPVDDIIKKVGECVRVA